MDDRFFNDRGFIESVLEMVQDGIYVLNPDMTIRYANGFMQNRYQSNAPLEGRKCFTVFQNRTAVCENCPAARCITSGKVEKETFASDAISPETFVELSAKPLTDRDTGRVTGVVMVLHYVTRQKQMAAQLQESEQNYRVLFENAEIGILVADSDHKNFIHANPAICRMLGYSHDELLKRGVKDIHPPESLDIVCSEFDAQFHKKKIVAENIPCLRKDGSVFYAQINSSPMVIHSKECLVAFFTDVTQQNKTEAALKLSQKRFRDLFENSVVSIMFHDRNSFEVIDANRRALDAYGIKDISELNSIDLWGEPPYSFAEAKQWCEKALKEGPQRFLWKSYTKDREVFWENVFVYALDPESDSPIVSISVDITEHKKAEEALLTSEARFKQLAASSSDAVIIGDDAGAIVFCNSTAEQMTGYTKDELLGKPFLMLQPAHRREIQERKRAEYVQKGFAANRFFESSLLRKNGEAFPVEVSSTSWKQAGRLFFGGFIRDITDRKQVEAALRKSEDRYRSLIDRSVEMIFLHDMQGHFIEVNQAVVDKLGYSKEELLKLSVFDVRTPNTDRDERLNFWNSMRIGQSATVETEIRTRTGAAFPVEVNTGKIGIGDEVYMLAFVRDVSDRKKAEQERLEMQRQLLHSQKLESLGVLAGGIAHDFNNLLLAMIGNLDMSLRKISPVSEARSRVENALKAAYRAADLTRQMLAYSGKGHFIVTDISLNELINENLHILKSSVSKSAAITLSLEENLPCISADIGQIQQVVMNLMTNASEAIGINHGNIHLSTGVRDCDEGYFDQSFVEEKPSPGKFVYLEIRDNGCGMDEETKNRLFEPFFTTKFVGRGLGMAAVIGIVRGHNGAVLVASQPGEGTTIRVLFPVSESAANKKPDPAEQIGADNGTIPKPSDRTVLIVDDESFVRDMCNDVLLELGYKTITAENGMQGLELFRQHIDEIDCVILDLSMPKMDGYETFTALKKIDPKVKVILSSGYGREEAMQRFNPKSLAGFIQKPYLIDTLEQELDRVLNRGLAV